MTIGRQAAGWADRQAGIKAGRQALDKCIADGQSQSYKHGEQWSRSKCVGVCGRVYMSECTIHIPLSWIDEFKAFFIHTDPDFWIS